MATLESRTRDYLKQLYSRHEYTFAGRTPTDVTRWAAAARPALRERVGLNRIRQDAGEGPPAVRLHDGEDLGDHTRCKGVLESEPGFDVPFWLLRPKTPGPHPLALFPHGHYGEHGLDYAVGVAASPEMAATIRDGDRDVAVQAVQRGFAAIAPATRGFLPACVPDVTGRHGQSNCRSQLLHALLAGRTVIGERVWDLQRLIDWAAAQPDIDTSRVLMMGNSGGGVATIYAAACDERITDAVASCSFCTYVSTAGAIHHCDCNAVPGILRFGDFFDVAGLIAPRRLLVVHGREDPLFATAEVERAMAGLRRIYDAAGVPETLAHAWGPGGHRFYSDLMWPFVMQTEQAGRDG